MKTIQRLYFYAIAFISIEVVLWGTVSLLRSIFKSSLVGGSSELAGALSAILVGIPIFLVHWLWAQWSAAKDDDEKTASIRAVFLYGILLATVIPVVQNLLALITRIFLSTAQLDQYRALVGGSQTWGDNLIAITINLLIAAYFWNILRFAWQALPAQDDFADIRRMSRFIWMLYGLMMVIYGAQQALDFALTLSNSTVLGEMGREVAVNAIALLVVGSPIWYFSWRVLQDALPDSAEKESPLRLGILYLLSLGGVITVLSTSATFFYNIFQQLFGAGLSWSELLDRVSSSISIGIPFAVIWAYYGKWLNQQFAFEEKMIYRAGKKRLYFYILSLIGVAVVFYGMQSLLSVLVNLISQQSYLSEGWFRYPLASSLSALLIGLPLWLIVWMPMQTEAASDGAVGDDARRSVIRKTYLYLVIFASVIGGMISAGILLYTLFRNVLGADSGDFGNTIINSLQTFVLFAILLLYHLTSLRRDGSGRTDEIEARQAAFGVLVFDTVSGKFGESVKAAFMKQAPKVQVIVVNTVDKIPTDLKVNTVILSGSLAVNTPENVEAWMRSFSGTKLIVADDAAGVFWVNDVNAAVESAKTLSEGEELRPQSINRLTSVWTYIAYVFAALFACQLLVVLLAFGVSMVTGF